MRHQYKYSENKAINFIKFNEKYLKSALNLKNKPCAAKIIRNVNINTI